MAVFPRMKVFAVNRTESIERQFCRRIYLPLRTGCFRTRHKLQFESADHKVLDANVHDVDRYTVYDPRNPLNQRRREASKQAMKQKAVKQ